MDPLEIVQVWSGRGQQYLCQKLALWISFRQSYSALKMPLFKMFAAFSLTRKMLRLLKPMHVICTVSVYIHVKFQLEQNSES